MARSGRDRRLGVTLSNLATLYRRTGDFRKSIEMFREAQVSIEKAYGPESPELVSCFVNWTELYRVTG